MGTRPMDCREASDRKGARKSHAGCSPSGTVTRGCAARASSIRQPKRDFRLRREALGNIQTKSGRVQSLWKPIGDGVVVANLARHQVTALPEIDRGPGLDKVAPDGVSTKTVRAVRCSTAARETDGTTTCIGIPEGSAEAKNRH